MGGEALKKWDWKAAACSEGTSEREPSGVVMGGIREPDWPFHHQAAAQTLLAETWSRKS